MSQPRLLDLFCGAGGCAKGYQQAGFYVIGIDDFPQPNYVGDEFILGDAHELCEQYAQDVDVIHASPPCQGYSTLTTLFTRSFYPESIPPVRDMLKRTGKPYIIENVENARRHLINPIKLCGSMFNLGVYRHRYFEVSPTIPSPTMCCNHVKHAVLVSGSTKRVDANGERVRYNIAQMREAMGISWMTTYELREAIPPAYCKWIGERVLEAIQ